MPTYFQADFEAMGAAVGVEIGCVKALEDRFEAAAVWHRMDQRRTRRTSPSKLIEKLGSVAKNARRLLKSLGIDDPGEAYDGPGDTELLEALVLMADVDEAAVIKATRRIGRLVEILEGTEGAADLHRRAKKAADEIARLGELTVPKGNSGDTAINDWIGEMMSLYRIITGKEPATSVGGADQRDEGIAGGPLIRFLVAAGKPLGIEYAEDAWRSRVRTVQKGSPRQN